VEHIQVINEDSLYDLINIKNGLFSPLTGFMGKEDYTYVIQEHCLANGSIFPIPITLPIDEKLYQHCSPGDMIHLWYQGSPCADLKVESVFQIGKSDIFSVFGTVEREHPGVAKERNLPA
jgi:sulfate adenylyltransferase